MIESIGNIRTKIDKKLLDINSDIVKLAIHDFISSKNLPKSVKDHLEKIAIEINKKIIEINGTGCIVPNDEIYSLLYELNEIYSENDSLISYINYLKNTISSYINTYNDLLNISPKYIELKCPKIYRIKM